MLVLLWNRTGSRLSNFVQLTHRKLGRIKGIPTVSFKAKVVVSPGFPGVEMEALTAVQVGLLTVYDMVKAVDRGMVISDVRLLEKHGGKSGDWAAPD